ncbi:hypothetical protein LTR56_004056 [Elasticomyces elasticus]|nr:hypothetical protein LTR56_004056 [Elasticomyces elasticus]KAK3661380.1 hypothetical protein LTR22_007587 [Elasticomyces elasticus]KAK4928924.1 hypothetical protein LTR49_004425 [Elasticomyces elasticus]KAK5765410.1 hypothetical protein LTS12_004423 [Elasticomyces elasticus]
MELPYLDLANIDDSTARLNIGRTLATQSRMTGWAILTNHGITSTAIQSMHDVARSLLAMPPDEQNRWLQGDAHIGYSPTNDHTQASVWLSGNPGTLTTALEAGVLPPDWVPHIQQVEIFKYSCQQLIQKLMVSFGLAMSLQHDRRFSATTTNTESESNTQFRIHRVPAGSRRSDKAPKAMFPTSTKGSIALVFLNAPDALELDMADGEWAQVPRSGDSAGTVLAYLGDVVPFWSRGHMQPMKYRLNGQNEAQDVERFAMSYVCTTSPGIHGRRHGQHGMAFIFA